MGNDKWQEAACYKSFLTSTSQHTELLIDVVNLSPRETDRSLLFMHHRHRTNLNWVRLLLKKISQSGFQYNGSIKQLTDIFVLHTSPSCRSEQNGRLVKNILSEAIISLSNRLSFHDSGPKLITLEDEDIAHGCKMFGEKEAGDGDASDVANVNKEDKGDDIPVEQEKEADK